MHAEADRVLVSSVDQDAVNRIARARGGSEDSVVGEQSSPRSRHASDASLEEGRGLEAERLGAVGAATSETEE